MKISPLLWTDLAAANWRKLNMSKRIIALVLCAGMLLLGGCASEGATTAPPATSSDVESPVESETVPPEESAVPTVAVEEPTEADEPEEIAGIIAVIADWQTGMNFTIVSIDPDTGEQQTISYFDVSALDRRWRFLHLRFQGAGDVCPLLQLVSGCVLAGLQQGCSTQTVPRNRRKPCRMVGY